MKPSLPCLSAVLTLGLLPLAAHAQALSAPSAASSDLSQYATADTLWQHIQDVKKGPKTRPSSAAEYQAVMSAMVTQLFTASNEFVKRYPNDQRKWDARLLQIDTGAAIQRVSGRESEAAVIQQLQGLANEKEAPAAIRGQVGYELLGMSLRDYMQGNNSVTAASIVAQFKQFTHDYPTYPSIDVLEYRIAQSLAGKDPATSETLLKELAASGEGKIADQARKEIETKARLKNPLDLHFAAVDGTKVDLSAMRGKVILVDFWATWCGPYRAELPHVLEAYKKLHDKGFEIVGISLDQDKDALVKYTAQNGMTWPQYFDGKGWQNAISSSYGIQSIPAMWLVNKKGIVVTTNGRVDLADQVEKLLAE